jgi:(R,R)-butanediol dehydrogenase/meso-butanediol dehydrogenase/diacetyl reductase
MRAAVLHAAGDVRIDDRDEPGRAGPGQVLLTVTRAGVCGTDASEYAAGPILTPLDRPHPATGVRGPIVLGHEFIGVVEQVGGAVERFEPGDRVAAGAGVWCGTCDWCTRGQTNLCASYWTFGLSADGGLTERIVVPEAMLQPIASQVGDDNAALAQPLAVGLHAVDRSRVRPGDVSRLSTARKLGAEVTVNAREHDPYDAVAELTASALADVAIEASGVLDGLDRVQRLTRRGGTILLVGLPKGTVSLRATDLILREIDVTTTVAHVCDTNLPAALDVLCDEDLASLLVERVVPLQDVVEGALRPMVEGTARGKYLVDPRGSTS